VHHSPSARNRRVLGEGISLRFYRPLSVLVCREPRDLFPMPRNNVTLFRKVVSHPAPFVLVAGLGRIFGSRGSPEIRRAWLVAWTRYVNLGSANRALFMRERLGSEQRGVVFVVHEARARARERARERERGGGGRCGEKGWNARGAVIDQRHRGENRRKGERSSESGA